MAEIETSEFEGHNDNEEIEHQHRISNNVGNNLENLTTAANNFVSDATSTINSALTGITNNVVTDLIDKKKKQLLFNIKLEKSPAKIWKDFVDVVMGTLQRDEKRKSSGVNSLRELGGWEVAGNQVRDRFQQFGQRMSTLSMPPVVNTWIESGKSYASENPLTSLTLLALGVTFALPVVVFLSFAFATLFITFVGFLFVEGTLLTVASVFLGGILLIVGFFTLTFVSCALLAYLGAAKVYTLITGDTEPHKYLGRLPLIGFIFTNFDHSGANGDAMKIPNGFEDDDAASDESLAHTD